MADFLLVHDAGQGSWCWGRVWGHLTAPVEHPPRLYSRAVKGRVVALDLPGHRPGDRGDASSLTYEDFVSAVTDEIHSQGLHDLIMVGHGAAAPLILQAAAKLEEPPRRVVVFAGIIPDDGKSTLAMLPRISRLALKSMSRMSRIARKDLRLPKAVITNVYCNGMDPFDVIQIVGRFGAIPFQLFQTPIRAHDLASNLPVTYVPLWRDRLVPSRLQRRMAERIAGVEIAPELDSCHEVTIELPRQVARILLKYV